MITGGGRPRTGIDAARWLSGIVAIDALDLGPALDQIAQRVHDLFPVNLVAVHVVDELDPEGTAHGYCVGPSAAAQTLAPLLTEEGVDPIGLGDAARESGEPVVWQRIVSEPSEIARLAKLAGGGGPAGALHRLLLDASGLAVPMGTPHQPRLGAVALVSLSLDQPVPDGAVATLALIAPQIALTARNHQLAARNRRNRRTLEAVIASNPMGVVVGDLRGRLSMANAAASEILGLDLEPLVGRTIRSLIDERVKWRFVNPEEFATRVRGVFGDPVRETTLDVETVDGQALEISSSPVRDTSGAVLGRVLVLHDVTRARAALADARRLAHEQAELLEREERRAQEEVGLTRAAHRMASAVTEVDIGEALLEYAHLLVPRCDKSAMLRQDRHGDIRAVVARGFDEESVRRMDHRAGEGIVGRIVVDRRPFICNDTEVDARVNRAVHRKGGIRSFLNVPIMMGERAYGVLSVTSRVPRAFGERELVVVTQLARHAGSALQHALRYEQERHIAETLQQALLAERLPEVEGLELAALYEPAAGSQVGGDFYSAWQLADGRLALLVGDVSGKGVEAAGVTAMVRYMAEALSQHCADPADLVTELNELLCMRMADGALVTLVLAVIDQGADMLHWCVAGHPPPVILSTDGAYRVLDDPDPPCGIFPHARFRAGVAPFGPGEALVLYTDGVIEARRVGSEFGEAALRDVLVTYARDAPADLARAVYSAARDWCGGRLGDDVAIAVVRRTSVPAPAPAAASPRGR